MSRSVISNADDSHTLQDLDPDTGSVVREQEVPASEDLGAALAAFWPPTVQEARDARNAVVTAFLAGCAGRQAAIVDDLAVLDAITDVNAYDLSTGWPTPPA